MATDKEANRCLNIYIYYMQLYEYVLIHIETFHFSSGVGIVMVLPKFGLLGLFL